MSTTGTVDAGVGIGEIFIEKYRVDAILGHGGMGVVALCTHLALNEQVAIKMLRRDVLDDADAVERFMREAQAAVKLKSEFVARVSDVGRSDTNVPYMVMEYLIGHDLGQLLEERGSLGQPWAVEMTLQACEALCEAHSIGIVHRDIKPTNLFVTWRPDGSAVIKVLDFGISKSPIITAMKLTQTQSLLGTPAYMSPEQMRNAREVDARTDIWSLGTVLYELIEGRRPFEAVSFSEMCVKVAVDPPAAMTNAPPELQAVVLRCLEKAPERRYESMAGLGAALAEFSQDPHQAKVLVERMSRMLRRTQSIDWDPARNSMPIQLRDVRSAERKVEAGNAATPVAALPAARASGLALRASGSAPRISGSAAGASTPAPGASTPAPGASTPAPGASTPPPRASGSLPGASGPASRASGSAPRISGSMPRISGATDRVRGAVPAPWRRWRRALLATIAVVAAATVGIMVPFMRDPDDSSPSPSPAQQKIVEPQPTTATGSGTSTAPAASSTSTTAPAVPVAPSNGDTLPAAPSKREPVDTQATTGTAGARGSAQTAVPQEKPADRDGHAVDGLVGSNGSKLQATRPAAGHPQSAKPGNTTVKQDPRPSGTRNDHEVKPAAKPPCKIRPFGSSHGSNTPDCTEPEK